MIKHANREDVDKFIQKTYTNDDVFPYMSTSKYFGTFEIPEDDWNGILLTNETHTFLLKITIKRADEVGFNISLYALSSFSAGKALITLKEVINRYKPRYIDTVVHASNEKSIKLNTKLMGKPWGIEPKGAWNSKLGEYEELLYFRKLFA
jgi:hypothetical protein